MIYRWILFHNFISNSLKIHHLFANTSHSMLPSLRTSKQSYLHNIKSQSNSMDFLRTNKMLIRRQKSWLFLSHTCFYSLLGLLLPALLLHYLSSQGFSNSQPIILAKEEGRGGVLHFCENLCSLLPLSELEQFGFEEVIYTRTSITYNLLCSVNSLFDLWRVQ